ncbi:MAG TPA: hypothetical protein VFP68_23415 [Burkholderiaceae bacterium]|nr:hypothetical protein [Burkholderiaceae bacterium]
MAIGNMVGKANNMGTIMGNVGSTAGSGVASELAVGWAGAQGTGEDGAAISEMVGQAGQSIALLKAQAAIAKAIGFQQLKTSLAMAFAKAMKSAGDDIKSLF